MSGEMTMGQLAAKFQAAATKVDPATDKALRTLAQVGVGYVKQEIQAVHAVDTGTMLNSVTEEKQGKSYLIGPTVKYAPYVALGTSRMPARPFHIRAAKRLQNDIQKTDILKEIGL
ncbi:minor capsid protein [Microbacterium phage WilliamStrong]|nr:minor capsid protein [Microbacterium phage WilliamStrong]